MGRLLEADLKKAGHIAENQRGSRVLYSTPVVKGSRSRQAGAGDKQGKTLVMEVCVASPAKRKEGVGARKGASAAKPSTASEKRAMLGAAGKQFVAPEPYRWSSATSGGCCAKGDPERPQAPAVTVPRARL